VLGQPRSALTFADSRRVALSAILRTHPREELGQFLTPAPTARLMASLFRDSTLESIRILDAGAGMGALTAACIDEICARNRRPKQIRVVAYEVDGTLLPHLESTMDACRAQCNAAGIHLSTDVRIADFIEHAVDALRMPMFSGGAEDQFDLAIVNPPYKKIRGDSRVRAVLRSVGIETTNLYSAFLSLIVRLLAEGGELVMISPRSFCNGPYFRSFRREYLAAMATQRVHIFESRKAVFRDDDVLQENIIVHAVKDSRLPRYVRISSSSGHTDAEVTERIVPYSDFVSPSDGEFFIHIVPEPAEAALSHQLRSLPATLQELGISVSTGRVVDFRARQWLRHGAPASAAPLIYPMHLKNGGVEWPRHGARKADAIIDTAATARLLVTNDHYVLVKRFSAKEERRRVVAAHFQPQTFACERVGFENHLNYFHMHGHGLEPVLARGLTAFLNSTPVDRFFRHFNGHTQVNANDLRSLRYPTASHLRHLGLTVESFDDQSHIDEVVCRILKLGAPPFPGG
jgi:adenine-specific DNA-methyltransferase